jgi:hypothetical protein
VRIIGPPSAARAHVLQRVAAEQPVAHERFLLEMFPALWDAAVAYDIDPVGVIAQSGKETSWGRFSGKVLPGFYNTCGLKNRHLGLFPGLDDADWPLAHARFASWETGAVAHVQHLCGYAGLPVHGLIVDPRYWLVAGKHRLENWSELGGKWAPAPSYGTELETVMRRLQADT